MTHDRQNEKKNIGNIENALEYTGFGLYSIITMLMIFLLLYIKTSSLHALNYIIPYAMCDMAIDSVTHGALNSASLFGEALLNPIWGTLSDRYGRKPVLFVITILGFVFSLGVVFATNSIMLFIFSFCMGLLVGGTVPLAVTILCETHHLKYRSTLVMYIGMCTSLAQILFPVIAIGVIPLEFQTDMGIIKFKSWRLFLFIQNTLPCLLCFIFIFFIFESPKYLLTNINSLQGIEVLKKIYKLNTRKEVTTFPYTDLEPDQDITEEKYITTNTSITNRFYLSLKRMKPLFVRPYFLRLVILLFLFFANGLSGSIQSWIPQFLATLSDYQIKYGSEKNSENVCEVISVMAGNGSSNAGESSFCSKNTVDASRFINSIILSSAILVSVILQTILLKFLSKKYILGGLLVFHSTCLFISAYLPHSMIPLMINTALYNCIYILIISLTSDAFPTSIRAFGISTASVCSQIAPAIANLFLPSLLIINCTAPFIIFGSFILASLIFIVFIDKIFPSKTL